VATEQRQVAWKTVCTTVGFAFVSLTLSFLCFVQFQSPDRWARFDFFSVSYLVIKFLGSAHSLYSGREAFRSEALRSEWWGTTSDPNIVRSTQLLLMADLLVFLDYGHWQTLGALANPVIQGTGLALYVLAKVWQLWTDSYLAGYFAGVNEADGRTVMNRGPFRYVRHPRYAGVILGKLGCALIFCSIFGWLLLVVWAAVFVRKISREEKHMRQLAGPQYGPYSRRTARMIPGIY
jgi:protein-S-isoprenylcysteine O-methyltransferase Ste14